jgi:integrase
MTVGRTVCRRLAMVREGPGLTTSHGGFVEPRNTNRMFHDPCKKADVPQLRVDDFRHSCATLLFTMGVRPAIVQPILRHSSFDGQLVRPHSRASDSHISWWS